MLCPRCDLTMVQIDDCGDGTTGHECQGCGMVRSDADEPCEKGIIGSWCKQCHCKATAQSRSKNPERAKERERNYREANREGFRERKSRLTQRGRDANGEER